MRFYPRDYVGKKVAVNLSAQGTVVLKSKPISNVYINKKYGEYSFNDRASCNFPRGSTEKEWVRR